MVKTLSKTAGLAAAILLTATLAWAVCDKCRYTNRGNRYEGVADEQVSSGSFDPLAVQYRSGTEAETAPDQLSLYFWLPAALTPTIEVREPSRTYMMHPLKKRYDTGLQSFSWPTAEVIRPLAIKPSQLLAKVSDSAGSLYFPAYLSTGGPPAAGGSYAFFFESGAGIEASCIVSREEGGNLVQVSKWDCSRDYGGKIRFDWNGRDAQGQPAPPGRYTLRIRGDMLAESPRSLNATINFLHYGHFE